VALLAWGTRPMGEIARFDARFHKRIWRILAASLLMALALWLATQAMAPMLAHGGWRYLAVILLIAGGAAVYGLGGQAIGAFRLGDFRGALRRG